MVFGAAVLGVTSYSAHAATVVTTLEDAFVVDGEGQAFGSVANLDVNGDGEADFEVYDDGDSGSIGGWDTYLSLPYSNEDISYDYFHVLMVDANTYGTGSALFPEGAEIGWDTATDFEWGVDIYGGSGKNLLPEVGDSGYLGFVIEYYVSCYEGDDYCLEYAAFGDTVYTNHQFGWLHVEHGSVVIDSYGLGEIGGSATVPSTNVSAVPLPAGLPLLLAGLGAFGLARRRG